MSHMERFVANLKSKLQIAFGDASECLRFMDLNGSETIRIEEFMFAVQFFIAGAGIADIILLFNQLDINQDGRLDLIELDALLPSIEQNPQTKKNSMSYRAKYLSTAISPRASTVVNGGFKTILSDQEILDLPLFSKTRKEKYNLKVRGQEYFHEEKRDLAK